MQVDGIGKLNTQVNQYLDIVPFSFTWSFFKSNQVF